MSNILLVDDSPSDRALFRTILMRGGFQVHERPDGTEFLEQVRSLRPLAVVLDVNLPDTDGHTLCRMLKADPTCSGTPVLMLTVRDNEADILAGLQAGADDYVAKDSASEIVLARVKRLVHDRQLTMIAALNQQLVQIGRLLAGIVHEIRAPLAVIRGNAEVLRMNLDDNDAAVKHVDPIVRNAQLMQVRLEHLMAAVRGGPAALRKLEIGPVVHEAGDLFMKGIDLQRGRVRLELDLAEGLPPVKGDAGRLIQVLINLLGNAYEAIAASSADGLIRVRVRPRHESRQDWLTVEVADTGPGIPEPVLARIFEPFFTTKSEGTGYGLYLASEILREHGGRLTACNEAEGGACMTLWLPLADTATDPGQSMPDQAAG